MKNMNAWSLFAPLLAAALALPSFAMPPAAPVPRAPGTPLSPVILDPGHGGEDLGAVVRGVKEKDLALVFAKKLKARLARNAGLPVVMTRDTDRYVTLDGRLVDSVDMSGSIFVSLHLNQARGKKASGAIVYSYGPQKQTKASRKRRFPSVPPMPAPSRGQAVDSARLARTFSRALRAGGFKAEARRAPYYVLKNPAAPSVLIELGFLNNPGEAAKLRNGAYQDRMVNSLAKAIEEYAVLRDLHQDIEPVPSALTKR